MAVDQLESQRQKFSRDEKIDLQQLSRDIQEAVKDSTTLDQAGHDKEAIDKLLSLQKYAPLERFPDFNVQALCARIYRKLADERAAKDCRERAVAMAEILQKRSGSGVKPDDPVRVVMIGEVNQWIALQAAAISDIQGYQYRGTDLQRITYTSASTGGKPAVAYFLINPRAIASIKDPAPGVFDPLPVTTGDGKFSQAYRQAHEQRIKFLADRSFNYPELIQLCRESFKQAMQLARQGNFDGALARMKAVEKIRPIRDIPIFDFISAYSMLLGKAGYSDAQADVRLYLFGIAQDIAHSGDGLSPASAIRVVAVDEEYAWLNEKKLRLTKQALIQQGDSRYDVLDTTDDSGKSQTFYFEVSQIFDRQSPGSTQ
ncbi:DUF4919 domain-containing protein [Burkholderia sp. 4701]|nr:DUF4919 domain-containing protein [Burkholderia sp. 4701]MXN86473.1 DUF4919 domain-containing protein [Burkholderia sp. 4812]